MFTKCQQCGVGIDDDRDGNCSYCANWPRNAVLRVAQLNVEIQQATAVAIETRCRAIQEVIDLACSMGGQTSNNFRARAQQMLTDARQQLAPSGTANAPDELRQPQLDVGGNVSNLFRKRPVVIEAVQWTGQNVSSFLGFIPLALDTKLVILTLEGDMKVSHGDWIIKGVKGEFYPCKPDIFEATYEPACATANPVRVATGGGCEMKTIPISSAEMIANNYGYDQVVIVARSVGKGEHVTTYGKDKENCDVAARCGDFLKYKIMGWSQEAATPPIQQIERRDELRGSASSPIAKPQTLLVARCFWCEQKLPDDGKHDCPAKVLTPEEIQMSGVIVGAECCDHFCCGLPPNVCKARRLTTELKSIGWQATANPIEREAVERSASDAYTHAAEIIETYSCALSFEEIAKHIRALSLPPTSVQKTGYLPDRAAAPKSEDVASHVDKKPNK